MSLGLDIPAITKMPGGEVMQLVRDILNDEAFRVSTFEEQLIKHGLGGGLLNAERVAVVRALGAWSDATTLMLTQAQDDATRGPTEARKVRRVFVKAIADQMRAALIAEEGKGADHDGAAA